MTDPTPTGTARTAPGSANRSTRRRARKGHAAPLARIVAGGLSLSAACALMTGMALTTRNADTADTAPVTLDQASAELVVPVEAPTSTVVSSTPGVTIVVRHHPAADPAGAAPAASSTAAGTQAAPASAPAPATPKATKAAPKAPAPVTKSRAS